MDGTTPCRLGDLCHANFPTPTALSQLSTTGLVDDFVAAETPDVDKTKALCTARRPRLRILMARRSTVLIMAKEPDGVDMGAPMVTEWSDYALDKFVAPEMSKFTAASIPDVSKYQDNREFWVRHFFLSTVTRATPSDPIRQYMANFLRRTEMAFQEYELARGRTVQYLETPRGRGVSHYMAAIGHWEVFLGQAWHATLLLTYMAGLDASKDIYKQEDGSIEQRMNFLYNRSKHAEKSINNDFYPKDGTLCLWLCNDGLKVVGSHLTFNEMAEVLGDLAMWADRVQDPATMREKVARDVAARIDST